MSNDSRRKTFFLFGGTTNVSNDSIAGTGRRTVKHGSNIKTISKKQRPFSASEDLTFNNWEEFTKNGKSINALATDMSLASSSTLATDKIYSHSNSTFNSTLHERIRPKLELLHLATQRQGEISAKLQGNSPKGELVTSAEEGVPPALLANVSYGDSDYSRTHTRNLSEVDQLVDHLDQYITISTAEEKQNEVERNTVEPTFENVIKGSLNGQLNDYGQQESPIVAVSPLDISNKQLLQNTIFTEAAHETKCEEHDSSRLGMMEDIGSTYDQLSFTSSTQGYIAAINDMPSGYQDNPTPFLNREVEDTPINQVYGYSSHDGSSHKLSVVNVGKGKFYINDTTTEEEEEDDDDDDNSTHTRGLRANDNFPPVTEDGAPRCEEYLPMAQGPTTVPTSNEAGPQHVAESQYTEASTTDNRNSMFSSKPLDKNVRLVSSYIEELRLKYFPTSNSLQPPPSLPIALKARNSMEQPQNVKVRIRTSTRQVGIKHGRAKQKLLSLETANEDDESILLSKVDHTKEFKELLSKDKNSDEVQSILNDIPGDEAYDSDDLMAPLRESKDDSMPQNKREMKRTDTVTSYFTKTQGRLRSGTLDQDYNFSSPISSTGVRRSLFSSGRDYSVHRDGSDSNRSNFLPSSSFDYTSYQNQYGTGLKVANPDSDSE